MYVISVLQNDARWWRIEANEMHVYKHSTGLDKFDKVKSMS